MRNRLAIASLALVTLAAPALAGDWRIEPGVGDRLRVLDHLKSLPRG